MCAPRALDAHEHAVVDGGPLGRRGAAIDAHVIGRAGVAQRLQNASVARGVDAGGGALAVAGVGELAGDGGLQRLDPLVHVVWGVRAELQRDARRLEVQEALLRGSVRASASSAVVVVCKYA